MTFDGKNLYARRQRLGVTRAAFAQELGVSQRTVEAWESPGGVVPERYTEEAVRAAMHRAVTPPDPLVNVNVRIAAETLRKLDDMAAKEDRSRSQMVRMLIERALA